MLDNGEVKDIPWEAIAAIVSAAIAMVGVLVVGWFKRLTRREDRLHESRENTIQNLRQENQSLRQENDRLRGIND